MNFENVASILKTAFNLKPLSKSIESEPQSGIILYSIAADQTPMVVLIRCSDDNSTSKWEIPQNLNAFSKILMNSKSEPLLKKLSADRIEALNPDGTIGAVRLMPDERRIIESYLHRHWQSIGRPDIEIFRLNDFMDFRSKELNQPNQIDILKRFREVFGMKNVIRELVTFHDKWDDSFLDK